MEHSLSRIMHQMQLQLRCNLSHMLHFLPNRTLHSHQLQLQPNTQLTPVLNTPRSDVAPHSAPLATYDAGTGVDSSDEDERPSLRSHSKGVPGWNTRAKYAVKFNEKFQPVGDNAKRLRSQLGILVRDGQRLPLTTLDWTCFEEEFLDDVWAEVQRNLLDPPNEFKEVCLRICRLMWKDYKAKTKTKYFTKVQADPDLHKKCLPNVLPVDWVTLLAYWRSDEAQKQLQQNSKNRDKHGPAHVTGRKSFAEVTHERCKAGQPTDKMSMWVSSRKADDPDVIETIHDFNALLELEPEDQHDLDSVKDRIFHRLIGPDGHGYCRTFGASVPPRLVYESSSSTGHVGVRELQEIAKQLELNLKAHLDNHIEKRIQDLRSEWMASCRCNDGRGSHSNGQPSVHQTNQRELVGEGVLVLSTDEQALNTSTELEADTEQSAHRVNEEDAT